MQNTVFRICGQRSTQPERPNPGTGLVTWAPFDQAAVNIETRVHGEGSRAVCEHLRGAGAPVSVIEPAHEGGGSSPVDISHSSRGGASLDGAAGGPLARGRGGVQIRKVLAERDP